MRMPYRDGILWSCNYYNTYIHDRNHYYRHNNCDPYNYNYGGHDNYHDHDYDD
jgi:hypothetical protein